MIEKRTLVGRKIDITDDMKSIAAKKAKELGQLKNSIRGGKGNFVAFLGEEIAKKGLKEFNARSTNTYNHDLIIDWEDGEPLTIEVKTKDRTVDPRGEHNATVANFNTKQKADYYLFVSVFRNKETNEYEHGHVVALISKQEFKEIAVFYREGEEEPDSYPKFYFRADCHNVKYMQMNCFEEPPKSD